MILSRKILFIAVFGLSILPSSAQVFYASDITSFQSALTAAESLPNENHTINITGGIQMDSAIYKALNLEILGNNSRTLQDFDLNGKLFTFAGANKTSSMSNLNIIADKAGSGILNRNQTLSINNSVLSGHTRSSNELIRSIDGSLNVTNSTLQNNNAFRGAGIYFDGVKSDLKNNEFVGNNASFGGAIFVNKGVVDITKSNFRNNTSTAGGGAVYVNSDATVTLDGTNFDSNSVTSGSSGGALVNMGNLSIKNNSSFTNNNVLLGSGGAISNSGVLEVSSALFENNKAKQDGGAITDVGTSVIKDSVFRNNESLEYFGGAIASVGDLSLDNCIFDKNSAYEYGGAVCIMQGDAKISDCTFTNNTAQSSLGGGAIINYLSTVDITGSNLFENNYSKTNGGAIIGTKDSVTNISGGTKFLGNKADGLGGGIFSQGVINLTSNSSDDSILFSGNQDSNGSSAVHLDVTQNPPIGIGTMNINLSNGGKVIFDDNISGVSGTKININGTSSYNDRVYFGSANENLKSDIEAKNVSLEFYNDVSALPNAFINAENTHFNFMNNSISQYKMNLNLIGDANSLSLDVDPANSTCDYLDLQGTSRSMNSFTIRDINVLSEPVKSTTIFDIFDHSQYGSNLTLSEKLQKQTVYGAIKKYAWALTPKLTLIELAGLNPNIQRYQSATASAFMNQMLSYDYSLNRTDEIYTNLREGRLAQSRANSYAYVGRGGMYVDQFYEDGSAFWMRPYVNLESFHLSGASSTVGNQSYGAMFGFDFPMYVTKNDWKLFSTIYGAYIGSSQQYEASNMYQNGGYGGYLLSAYKDDFYLGWTINGGGLGVESRYAGGKDDYAIVTAGTALKLAYNLKYKRLILQPNFTTAYTFLSPMNLVNFQGVDVNQSLVNGLTLAPSLMLTYRNEEGFEPYIFGGCVIPIMSDIKARADSTTLEKLTLNAWAQFGAGVRKRISERVTCFAQTVIRTGGRVGWGLMFNVQIAI